MPAISTSSRDAALNAYFVIIATILVGIATLIFLKRVLLYFFDIKSNAIKLGLTILKSIPGGKAIVNAQTRRMVTKFAADMSKSTSEFKKFPKLPKDGMKKRELFQLLDDIQKKEEHHWKNGACTGTVYVGDEEQIEVINTAFSKFTLTNPLHTDTFPSNRKFEAEIIRMSLDLLGGNTDKTNAEACGSLTSGGTESILMALKAYRDSRPDITYPEVITATTVHPAFDKGGQYFGIKIIHVPVDPKTFKMDLKAVKDNINSNTIAIVGSAPGYPHGIIDDIPALSKLAIRYSVGLHVDCCLGGYFLPFLQRSSRAKEFGIDVFDFRLPGVTTISADLHKYGMAPKGTSVVLFRTWELRRFMYFVYTEWPGGQYASPTVAGSRPGALIAGAWAMLVYTGERRYIDNAEKIRDAVDKIANGIRNIPGLEVVGDPLAMIVAWRSNEFDIFKLGDAMSGWHLGIQQKPPTIHLCVTPRHIAAGIVDEFLSDLKKAVKAVRANPSAFKDKAPLYGIAASMPDRSVIKGFVTGVLDAVLDSQ